MTTATIKNHEHIQFARKCDCCNQGMNEGYLIWGGEEYYCTEKCLRSKYSAKQWLEMYDDGNSECMWTAWECPEDYQYYVDEQGELQEI